jgi:hypothetical protein
MVVDLVCQEILKNMVGRKLDNRKVVYSYMTSPVGLTIV